MGPCGPSIHPRLFPRSAQLLVLIALGAAISASRPAAAATWAVTDCGDSGSPTQLRATLAAAAAGDTVTVPGCTITLDPAQGALVVDRSLTIAGVGAAQTILDGAAASPIFHLTGGDVTITGVTIRNGKGGCGGGVLIEGPGTRTISQTIITGNTAQEGAGVCQGWSSGSFLSVVDSVVSGNFNGGKPAGWAGGIRTYYGGSQPAPGDWGATVIRSTISGNAPAGITYSGPLTVTDSVISNNLGDGIRAFGGVTTLGLFNSTVTGNGGWGVDLNSWGGSTAVLFNSTISGNGSGVLVQWTSTSTFSSAFIRWSSVVANTSVGLQADDRLGVGSSIVANTTGGPNCQAASGMLNSEGHNVESANTCGFTSPGDLANTDPRLGPLQDNGGPTPTHALLPDSPAIDAGNPGTCPPADQRGVARPQDGNGDGVAVCDIGAFEVVPAGSPPPGPGLTPTLALTLGKTSFHPGETFQLAVTAANPGPGQLVDVFVGALLPPDTGPAFGCPAGDPIAFLADGFTRIVVTCLSAPPQGFPPLFQGTMLPAALPATSIPLSTLQWPAGAPLGTYTFFLVLTPPNAFTDGRVDATDFVALSTSNVVLGP